MLYLTSVLSKSSLSTAEKFGAGSAQFLGSWVISGYSSAHPVKDCGETADPFKDCCSLHRGNYCWKPLNADCDLEPQGSCLEQSNLSMQYSAQLGFLR